MAEMVVMEYRVSREMLVTVVKKEIKGLQDKRENLQEEQCLFDGVMILVLVLEQNLSTLEEQVGQTIETQEVVPTYSVYQWTLTI